MPHTGIPPTFHRRNSLRRREKSQDEMVLPGRTAFCLRRHRRILSPPYRPPEAETHPPKISMNVSLVDSRIFTASREPWRLYRSLRPASSDYCVALTGRYFSCLVSLPVSSRTRPWLSVLYPPRQKKETRGSQKRSRSTTPSAASRTTSKGWWTRYIASEFLPRGSSGLTMTGERPGKPAGRPLP